MDRPAVFYKYTSCQAARAIFQNCSIKLSIPQVFNDPFDILLEEALGSDVEDFLKNLMPALFDILVGELDHNALRPGPITDKILFINGHLKNLPADRLDENRKAFLSQPPESIWSLSSLRKCNQGVVDTIRDMLSTYGIFCSSTNKESLLMWSHYADHHRGVVLGSVLT